MDKNQREHREKTIVHIMDELSRDLEKTLEELIVACDDEEVLDKFHLEAKSKIHYWLTVLYDEMKVKEKNLEIAYDGAQQIIKRLKESQPEMQRPIFANEVKVKEVVSKKLDDR